MQDTPANASFEVTASSSPTLDDWRGKMERLSRTVGENIPPELVFGPKRSLSTRCPTRQKRVSAPILTRR